MPEKLVLLCPRITYDDITICHIAGTIFLHINVEMKHPMFIVNISIVLNFYFVLLIYFCSIDQILLEINFNSNFDWS